MAEKPEISQLIVEFLDAKETHDYLQINAGEENFDDIINAEQKLEETREALDERFRFVEQRVHTHGDMFVHTMGGVGRD